MSLTLILLIALNILVLINIIIVIRTKSGNSVKTVEKRLELAEKNLKDDFYRSREEINKNFRENRDELRESIKSFEDSALKRMSEISQMQKNQLDTFAKQLNNMNQTIEDKLTSLKLSINENAKENRKELSNTLKSFEERFSKEVNNLSNSTETKLEKIRGTVENKLENIQKDNSTKLEQMRATVEEKLHDTLEKRLGESFKLVNSQLEQVAKGLGEMQNLATGVGDLKKVLTNVKTKGVMGEYQLENILEQLLTPEQYAKNVKTKEGSNDMVEFAIKLPGSKDNSKTVWLPIDAKFPTSDYQQLLEAYDKADQTEIEKAQRQFAAIIKIQAKTIREKYIDPPNTTDFAIMFLPIEGIYAEVLRDAGLFETLQREYKVVITGPTTLSAILSSLQMGFRTLAIEKRSSQVWEILSAVKTEFGKFGDILEKTQKKLSEASNVIEKANVRTRAIERKLKDVERMPEEKSNMLLGDETAGKLLP